MGLRSQLAVSHAALALALVVVATVPMLVVSSQEQREALREAATREAETLAAQGRAHGLTQVARDAVGQRRASVVIVDNEGRLVGGGGPAAEALAPAARGAARSAIAGQADATLVHLAGGARAMAWQPVVDGDEVVGAVVVAEPPLGLGLRAGAFLFAALALLLVGLAGGLGWMLAGRIVGPLESLRAAVFRLALGDLSVRATGNGAGSTEVDALTGAFNRVVGRLDRTEREQSANRERRRALLRQLSHRLRTPLGILMLRIEEATDGPLPPDRRRSLARTLAQQVRSLEQITDEVLALAGREDESIDQPVRVDLGRAASDAVDRIRPLADWRRVSVELCSAPGSIVQAGAGTLTEAAIELMVNAVKFSAPGSLVEVQVGAEHGWARLVVLDRGYGSRPAPEAGSRRDVPPGSGVGLSLVSELVHRCGGSLRLEDRPGGGTVATVELPFAPEES